MVLLCLATASCTTERAYFQSPLHTNTPAYKAIPLRSDSLPSATYIGGSLAMGGANENIRDGFVAFWGTVHRSHNWRSFQAYYGLSAAVGDFHVDSGGKNSSNPNLNSALINSQAGDKFFGALGAIGGINVVVPRFRCQPHRQPLPVPDPGL